MEFKIIIEKFGTDSDMYPWFWRTEIDGDAVEENWSSTKIQAVQEAKSSISLSNITNT